jgi:cell division protein FtsL
MIRLSTIVWALLVAASGYAMFEVKYEVVQLEDELARTNRQIASGQEQIRVLNAEWSFLNQPARLDQLAKRFLTLAPIGTSQVGRLDTLPWRPPTPPAAVAAAAPPPVASLPAAAPQLANAKPRAER